MNLLPVEIVRDIVSFLPLKDQFKCRRVCHKLKAEVESVLKDTKKVWFVYNSWTDFLPVCHDPRHRVTHVDQIPAVGLTDFEVHTIIKLCPTLKVIVFDRDRERFEHKIDMFPTVDIIMAQCETMECFTDSSTPAKWHPFQQTSDVTFNNLRHMYVSELSDTFLADRDRHPMLTTVFTNFVSYLVLNTLPKGLKRLTAWDGKWVISQKIEEFVDVVTSPAADTLESLGPIMIQNVSLDKIRNTPALPKLKRLDIYIDGKDCEDDLVTFASRQCPFLEHLSVVRHFPSSTEYLMSILTSLPQLTSVGFGCSNVSAELIRPCTHLIPKSLQLYPTFQSVKADFLSSLIPILEKVEHFLVHIQASSVDTVMLQSSDILSFVESILMNGEGKMKSFKIIFEKAESGMGFRFSSLDMEKLRDVGERLSQIEVRKQYKSGSISTLEPCYFTELTFIK